MIRGAKLLITPKFHSEFLDPLNSFSVGYKSESNDANDSKMEDLGQLFCI